MQKLYKKVKGKPWIPAVAFCLLLAFAVFLIHTNKSDQDNIVTEDVSVEKVDMSQSVTAAGEVVTADEERIYFSTSKRFRAMCVEEDEEVVEGQHLILYSNGTYEDAPADGFVTEIYAPKSGTTAGSSNYLRFSYSKTMAIDITVPEGEINEVSVGDAAEIVVNADTSKTYNGKIVKKKAASTTMLGTDSSGTESSGSSFGGNSFGSSGSSPFGADSSIAYYTVTLNFENDGTLLPGMSAICTITISEKKGVLAVPIEAVKYDSDGNPYVVTVSGTQTKDVSVKTGDSDANYVEITEGLEGDETVRIERKGAAK